jgi:hypothetical protein
LEAGSELEKAIDDVAASDRSVGGPVSILQLKTSESRWIENPPAARGWKTICDIDRDYRAGKASISVLSSQQELDRYLDSSCSK